jgi:RHS repeat-associated protein
MKSNFQRLILVWAATFMGMVEVANAFYDPGLQRWINRDPIQEKGGVNLSGFVGNNPGNYIDSDGRLAGGGTVAKEIGTAVCKRVAPAVMVGPLAGAVLVGGVGAVAIGIVSEVLNPEPSPDPLPLPKYKIFNPKKPGHHKDYKDCMEEIDGFDERLREIGLPGLSPDEYYDLVDECMNGKKYLPPLDGCGYG